MHKWVNTRLQIGRTSFKIFCSTCKSKLLYICILAYTYMYIYAIVETWNLHIQPYNAFDFIHVPKNTGGEKMEIKSALRIVSV